MRKFQHNIIFFLLLTILGIYSCTKDPEFYAEPYPEGKQPLGIIFERTQTPFPSTGGPSTVVTFQVSGLEAFKDRLTFEFNGQPADISAITDKEIKVVVPKFASTGITTITIGDQVIFGPNFIVEGKVKIDPTWQAMIGSNNSIEDYFIMPDEKFIFVGRFTNYEDKGRVRPINRLARTYRNGMYDVSWRTGNGANGAVNSIIQLNDRYYIAGSFGGYDMQRENISNITKIYMHGQLDTMGVEPFRRHDQDDTTKYVPTFNGGFNSSVNQIYGQGEKIIAAGNFRYYVSRQYDKPNALETRDTVILDSVEIRQIARLNPDGSLDKTFRFSGDVPFAGGNGDVRTIRHESGELNGKIVAFGTFNRFDGQSVGYITRLNPDGTIDPTFNPGGAGADYYISNVTYSEATNKYMVVGLFRTFNGVDVPKMALLNADGTVDTSFQPKLFRSSHFPSYAKQLQDGLIIVGGDFSHYDNIARHRFMILKPDGNLAEGLNSTGRFNGYIYKALETTAENGTRAVLLMGNFSRFDNLPVSNIVRIIIED